MIRRSREKETMLFPFVLLPIDVGIASNLIGRDDKKKSIVAFIES